MNIIEVTSFDVKSGYRYRQKANNKAVLTSVKVKVKEGSNALFHIITTPKTFFHFKCYH